MLPSFFSFSFYILIALNNKVTVASIINFQNKGGNVLVAGSSSVSEFIRDLAIEYSAEFDEKGNVVKDPLHTAPSSSKDDKIVLSSRFVGSDGFLPASVKKGPAVFFRGVGHRLTGRNPLVKPILVGEASAYSYITRGVNAKYVDPSALVGSGLVYVSAGQARNNARIVLSGSVDLFSDELITKGAGE